MERIDHSGYMKKQKDEIERLNKELVDVTAVGVKALERDRWLVKENKRLTKQNEQWEKTFEDIRMLATYPNQD